MISSVIPEVVAPGALLEGERLEDLRLAGDHLLLHARRGARHQLRHLVQQMVDHPLRRGSEVSVLQPAAAQGIKP